MLTKEDLAAIAVLMDSKFKTELSPIHKRLNAIHREMKKELKPIKSQLRTIQSGLDAVVRFFDNELVNIEKRVSHLEMRE